MTLSRESCDPSTITATCAGGCERPMHTGRGRACAAGHPRHGARGLCTACFPRLQKAGKLAEYQPKHVTATRADEALDEWEHQRDAADFTTFGPRIGLTQHQWEALFERAAQHSDPRATLPRQDISGLRRGRLARAS